MLALLSSAAIALPGPVPLPDHAPGDSFVYSDGRVERVIRVDGRRTTWTGLSGASYQRSRNFIVLVLQWRSGRGSGRREVRGNPDSLWPMTKGRSARFRVITETKANPQSPARRSAGLWECRTAKPRMFAVAAGTYSAIPVKCDRYSPTTMLLLEQREWDYAPELGHYIRRVTVSYLRGATRTVELVAALSGPAASKARLAALARSARDTAQARGKP